MSDLTFIERIKLERQFQMGGGYVLDFSNRTLAEFVANSVGRDIYDARYDYASGSKANRLRAFWTQEANHLVGKLIADLLEYCRPAAGNPDRDCLFAECQRIAARLLQSASNNGMQRTTLRAASDAERSPRPSDTTPEKRARIVELIDEARHFRLRAAIDDSEEQLAVATGYRYLLIQLKRLAGPLLGTAESVRLDSLDVDVLDFGSACEAKAELDALLFDIEEALQRCAVNRAGVGTSEKTTLAESDSTRRSERDIKLSTVQEKEFERWGFKSRLAVVIYDEVEGQSRHVVTVAGRRVLLPPKLFRFLLKLVSELSKGRGGYVSRDTLMEGSLVHDEFDYNRTVGELRDAFRQALEGERIGRKDFIQTKRLYVRLSTHPSYVDWSRVKGKRFGKPRQKSLERFDKPLDDRM